LKAFVGLVELVYFSGHDRVVSRIGSSHPPNNVDLENTIETASGQALMQHPVVTTLIFLSSECTDYKQRVDAMAFGKIALFGRLRLEKETLIVAIRPSSVNP